MRILVVQHYASMADVKRITAMFCKSKAHKNEGYTVEVEETGATAGCRFFLSGFKIYAETYRPDTELYHIKVYREVEPKRT